MQKTIYRNTARTEHDNDGRIESLTNEFYFVIYHTYTGNRKTLAIYRNEDGELKEVHLVLNFKEQKNIGQKIKKAMSELKRKPINQLYKSFIEFKKQQLQNMEPTRLIMFPNEVRLWKNPNETIEQAIHSVFQDAGHNYEGNPIEKRVCRICIKFGDCQELMRVWCCKACQESQDFKQKLELANDKWHYENGFIKSSWCRCDKPPYLCKCKERKSDDK